MSKSKSPAIRFPKDYSIVIKAYSRTGKKLTTLHKKDVGRIEVRLMHFKTHIGSVELCKDYYAKKPTLRTHSFLNSSYHRKGLGTLLYAKACRWAIQNGWTVTSSGYSSEQAQRVWRGKGIRSFFRIRTRPCKDSNSLYFRNKYAMFLVYPKL